MRTFTKIAALAGAAIVFAQPVLAGGASTTRIETQPYYGAVVTIESGVRVFRPLPPTRRVVINPGGRTPLSLSINETEVTERRYNYNYNADSGREASAGRYFGGGFGGHRHRGSGKSGGGSTSSGGSAGAF